MFSLINELEKTISEEVQIYAEKEYTTQLIAAMLSKEASMHVSVPVDSMSLFESNIAFAHYMFQNPERALKLLDDAFQKVSLKISRTHVLKTDMVYKVNLHVRLIALPSLPEVYRSNLPNCSDVGQFLCISGTVVRASTAKMLQYKKQWRCSKCKYQFIIEAKVEQGYIFQKPLECKNPEFCNGKSFTMMSTDINTEWCKDYQEIKLQEQVYNLNVGTVPRSMWVVLEDDLVETCHPGNDVIISGILIQQWKPLIKGSPITIELVILAHNIEVQNKLSSGGVSKDMAEEFKQFWLDYKSDPLRGRNFILSSICSQVFGLYIVKLAVALVLAGGVQKRSGSSRIRGDSHLLLIGDPGTAKSQFLKFATKVSPRSVLTSGIGTTNAGLTVSAVKESGRWQLEAGALVLADGGICCIDEFSCIKEQDKTCIHEAMEQQTISVAKAGLVCSLNTRCSILAATNPKGRYDENLSISENTALGTPLLSRFDIILVLLDTYDENWDNMVASYILGGRNITTKRSSTLWTISKMKSYFTLIHHIEPKLTLDAERVLRSYYAKQRSLHSRNTSRTTPRLLQSLIRLAEGHARLMFRTEVLVIDAVIAITLIESSMLGSSVLEGVSPLHTVFPENPAREYIEEAEKVVQNLNIEVPIDECYKSYYEECALKNLLCDISSVWNSKDNPYIFGSPPSSYSSSKEYSAANEVDASKTTSSENLNMSDSTEDLFHKSDRESSNVEKLFAEKHNAAENNVNSYSLHMGWKKTDELISSPPQTKISSNENTNPEISNSKNGKKCTFLDENAKKNHDECTDAIYKQTNVFPFLKQNNIDATDGTIQSNDMNNSSHNVQVENNSSKSHFERSNIDILEELGISPEKEQRNSQINQPNTFTECSDTLPEKSDILSILSQKRSLADQLKKFAFSKCSSNPNKPTFSKATLKANINKPETLSSDARNSGESFKTISSKHNESNLTLVNNKPMFEKPANKNDCASDSNIFVNKNLSALNTSQSNLLTESMDTYTENENSNMICRNVTLIPEAKQSYSNAATNVLGNSSEGEQSKTIVEKNPVSDKLKMFVFSKCKKRKS